MPSLRVPMVTTLVLAACTAGERPPASSANARAALIERELPTLRRDSGTVLGRSAEGATIDAAYRGSGLRRLQVTFLGENGLAHETYYFDSTLFLVVRREEHYDAALTGRVQDATVMRFDLTRSDTPRARAESLATNARLLVDALADRAK